MRVTLHHSAGATDTLDSINVSHRNRGFPRSYYGYHVGYTYVLFPDGRKVQTRAETEEQAHTYGHNKDNIGVCLVGDFTRAEPTAAQVAALAALLKDIKNRWGDVPVYLHRELKATACPGIDLRKLVASYEEGRVVYRIHALALALDRAAGLRKRRIKRLLDRLMG